MKAHQQFVAPAGQLRGISTVKEEIHKEDLRMDRKLKIKREPRKSYYERQLEKFGFKS